MNKVEALESAELIMFHVNAARTDAVSRSIYGDIYCCTAGSVEYVSSSDFGEMRDLKVKLLVVLPFEWCSHKHVVPSQDINPEYLAKHLPYHIEDDLVSPIEDVEIFWRARESYVAAYVVDRALYTALRESLRRYPVELHDIIPEQELIFSAFGDSVLRLRDITIVSKSNRIFLPVSQSTEQVISTLLPEIEAYQIFDIDQDREGFLRERIKTLPAAACSLLDREEQWFKTVSHVIRDLEPFLRVVCAGCLVFCLYLALSGNYFSNKTTATRQQTALIFPQKFGPDRNISEVESLVRSQLRDHGKIVQYQFLNLLQLFAQARHSVGAVDVRIESIRFSGRGLVLGLVFQDFSIFQRLTKEIRTLASVDVKEINNQDGSLRATVTIY